MIDLTSRRLVIAYNPASTRAPEVKTRVFDRLRSAGVAYKTLRVEVASPNVNINNIAKAIRPGDIILSAAGDGSAHAVMNGVMLSQKDDVQLGFLAFGNFNDLPRSLGRHRCLRDPLELLRLSEAQEVHPLRVVADDQFDRWTLMYATLGWTATAAAQYDRPEVRSRLQRPGQAFMMTNLSRLANYYFRSRSNYFLPIRGEDRSTTDIMAINGPITARFFRSRQSMRDQRSFLLKQLDVSRLLKNIPFLTLSAIGRLPAVSVGSYDLRLDTPNEFMLQLDGEVAYLKDVKNVRFKKSDRPLTVLASKSRI